MQQNDKHYKTFEQSFENYDFGVATTEPNYSDLRNSKRKRGLIVEGRALGVSEKTRRLTTLWHN